MLLVVFKLFSPDSHMEISPSGENIPANWFLSSNTAAESKFYRLNLFRLVNVMKPQIIKFYG